MQNVKVCKNMARAVSCTECRRHLGVIEKEIHFSPNQNRHAIIWA